MGERECGRVREEGGRTKEKNYPFPVEFYNATDISETIEE